MYLCELNIPCSHIPGVGPALAQKLASIGIIDISQLLRWYPRNWEDMSHLQPLSAWTTQKEILSDVEVIGLQWLHFRGRRHPKLIITDGDTRASLSGFNRAYLATSYPPGSRIRVWAKYVFKRGEIQSSSFTVYKNHGQNPDGILPVYRLSEGISQNQLRKAVKQALNLYAVNISDEIPEALRNKHQLLPKAEALVNIHFPQSFELRDRAIQSLKYEELLHFLLPIARRAIQRRALGPTTKERNPGPSLLQKRLIERLPFSLTQGQEGALQEINSDIASGRPMARLIQGDVGSGKTLVAFLAALASVEAGGQVAIMAPTELLARQLAQEAAKLLEPMGLRLAALSGSVPAPLRRPLLAALAAGDIDIVIGTHALFSRDVIYKNLQLVIVDEQHRFGVMQRSAIMAKGESPHLIMMSATPIPRSLALTLFGDLDVSTIRDIPPGRKPVRTHLSYQTDMGKVYDLVRRELEAGRQAFFVYPLIEDQEYMELKDAVGMAKVLGTKVFPDFPIEVLHSKLPDEEKDGIMQAFRLGQVKILVATSVVEVGIDVPNASCMVIEHADRFGLAALHQLRGRVGRGSHQAYCFLTFNPDTTEDGKARLKVMHSHRDGFIIAEEDLRLRGPGQLRGLEQSGYISLGLADPSLDLDILSQAHTDIFDILNQDPGLLAVEHQGLAANQEQYSEVALG